MECLACQTPNLDGARFCAKCGAPLPTNPSSDVDPLIGKVVGGRYRITGILGEGGMGRVYTGEQQMGTNVRKAAVKTLLSQFAKDPQTVARFMREVGTVSELEHPNTIKVYDFGQIEGSGELYIAMELLAGKSLEDAIIYGQPMNPERVDRILGQICGSLQEAHDKGIVHRDLKPANIMLTTRAGEEDVVKVLDFGIAKKGDTKDSKNDKLTQQGTILGTPPYMSPEQFSAKELDARSDIYSLAIMTYEMLTGRLPFEAETPWQWMNQHLSVPPLPFEQLPQAQNVPLKMRAAVLRGLEKNRDRRPQSAREFYEELTLGAVRMSLLGSGTPSMPNIVANNGTLVQAQPPSRGSSGTQMGEPLYPPGYSQGAPMGPPGAPGYTQTGDHGMLSQQMMPPGVTSGGQSFAPQAPQKSGGGAGMILAIVGIVCLLGGGGGTAYWWYKTHHDASSSSSSNSDDDDGPKRHSSDDDGTSGGKSDGTTSGGSQQQSSTTGGGTSTSSGGDANPTPTHTTAPTVPTTPPGPGPGPGPGPQPPIREHVEISCCNSIPPRDHAKRRICAEIVSGVNAGRMDRSALAQANAQGARCH